MRAFSRYMSHIFYFAISTVFFIILTFFYEHPTVSSLNHDLQAMIYNFSEGSFKTFFTKMTGLGSTPIYVILCLILMISFLINKQRLGFIFVPANLIGSALLNVLLKNIFLKPRPEVQHLVDAHSFSFPSGHSMNALVFYGFLAFLSGEFFKKKLTRWIVWVVSGLLILLIGMSRVYLGVHFPIDVIGGYLAGMAWLSVIVFIYAKLKDRKQKLA